MKISNVDWDIEITDRKILFSALFFIGFAIYLYLLEDFLKTNLWWIFLTCICMAFFIAKDISLKNENFRNTLKIKPRRQIRINFWN